MRKVMVGLIGLAVGCDFYGAASAPDAHAPDARPSRDAGVVLDGPSTDAALCVGQLDQRLDPCPNGRVTECGNSVAWAGGQTMAQVFTPSLSGSLVAVRLWMWNEDKLHNTIEVAIADLEGEPSALAKPSYRIEDHLIARTSLRMSDELTWHDVVFPAPPDVVANQPYAIFVRVTSSSKDRAFARWVLYNDFTAPNPDWYPRGQGFARPAGATAWIPFASFQDFVFEARVFPSSCQ